MGKLAVARFIKDQNTFSVAVGVLVATAAQNVVQAFMDNIISPPILAVTGGVAVGEKTIKIGNKTITISYGKFLLAMLQFIIVIFVAFNFGRIMQALFNLIGKSPDVSAP
jgi:large conductance mechanosensitive channel